MKLTNTSAYHTATLRRIFTVTVRALATEQRELATHRAFDIRVVVREGRTRLRWEWEEGARVPTLQLRLPKLTGEEFIPLLRERYGGTPVRTADNTSNGVAGGQPIHAALQATDVALVAQQTVVSFFGWRNFGLGPLTLSVRAALVRAKVPQYVPLRIRKPPKEEEPRDVVAERYKRVLELETRWKTKLKLAQTKLKKLRSKRYHYEKKLGKRTTNQEDQ